MAYKQFVHPVIEYASAAWDSASDAVGWKSYREGQLGLSVVSDKRTVRLAPPVFYRS